MMLNEIGKKLKIALVVSHPDDEVLWFYGGLQSLSAKHDISILCLTFKADSHRGLELLNAVSRFKVKCFFGNLIDSGFNNCISNINSALEKFLADNSLAKSFDLMITHPYHGGEKPHPHHIQTFHAVKHLSKRKKIAFGFFSEKVLPLDELGYSKYKLSFKLRWHHNFALLKLLLKSSLKNKGLLPEILRTAKAITTDLILGENIFILTQFYVNSEEKIRTLQLYQSQICHLMKYNSIYKSEEYLYIDKNFFDSSDNNRICEQSI